MERDPERDPELDEGRESWGKTGELLDRSADDGVTVGRARLEEIAAAALAGAGAAAQPSKVRVLPRLVARLAAAAGLLIAVSLGVHFAMNPTRNRAGNGPGREPDLLPLPPPACLEDVEFVTNFDLIRDLPELDADSDLLDVDDDVLLLQALEGA